MHLVQPLNLAYVKSILIVDDSPLIRRSLRSAFEQQPDWAVCGEAEDGYEGIDKAKILQPDLIVIDLAMPRLNGISASRMLKKLAPATPVVMFTAFTNPCFRKAAFAAGLDAFVIPRTTGWSSTTKARIVPNWLFWTALPGLFTPRSQKRCARSVDL